MSAILHPTPSPAPVPEKRPPVPAAVEPRGRFPWKAGLLLLIVGAVAAVSYQLWMKPRRAAPTGVAAAVRTAKVVSGTLVRKLRVAGETSARDYALVTVPRFRGPQSRSNLTLLKLVEAGTMVKKGDLIASMDPQNARDLVDDMNDQVAQAEADIRKRKAEQLVDWGNLEQTLRIAKSDLDKATLDYRAAEVKTDIERELLRLSLEEAQASYKQQQADIAHSKESDRAEIRILELTRDQQAIHRDSHTGDIKRFEMRAPIPGLAVMQPVWRGMEMGQVKAGDMVYPGQPIVRIVDLSTMQVAGTVNQAETGELRLGQAAVVGLDAFPEVRLKGHVYSIGALAVRGWRENYYVRTVPVRISIDGLDSRVIPDLSAWAEVELQRQDHVLLVPREALHAEAGRTVVYVKSGPEFKKRPVELGIRDNIRAAVVSGLREGEEVALELPKSAPPPGSTTVKRGS